VFFVNIVCNMDRYQISNDGYWQNKWEESGLFIADSESEKEKFYCLVEFPYPSGSGLHVGHVRSYTALDIIARKRRMEGFDVLYPIGWDAFGLPTENNAIKTGEKPAVITKKNTDNYRRQMKSVGLSFDWSREIDTTDPAYYKWTQWMFLEFFDADMAYKKKMAINWCVDCKIGLANEEVVGGACERCGGVVEKRDKEQWMIAITKYADRLIDDLDSVEYLDKIKKQQVDWIGRSEGALVEFVVDDGSAKIEVFTTRPDTLFGASYIVLSPEHALVSKIVGEGRRGEVEKYVADARNKTDIERGDDTREKTGVFIGAYVVNPVNDEKLPVWVADYVLNGYGTGAIMAVPAHDERDFAFATKFGLEIRQVVDGGSVDESAYVGDGKLINSGFLDGMGVDEAKNVMIEWLKDKGVGRGETNFRLRDWVFSRQRYWGEPIPLVDCGKCGWVPVPVEELPLELPDVEQYEPTDSGESPLASIDEWVNTKCPSCGGDARRETDTMPNWAGSSWYFLRYIDAQNDDTFADFEKLKRYMPVDLYNGGMEHTTLHLLYSRFWNKFLFDRGYVPYSEPYLKRISHGLILAEDGSKMSKSKGNTVSPDDIVNEFGADTLRIYEMFIGPFAEPAPWSDKGLLGVKRFLDRSARLTTMVVDSEDENVLKSLHKMIKKVGKDIEERRFNTAVSAMMIFVNDVYDAKGLSLDTLKDYCRVLNVFSPHLCEGIWSELGGSDSVSRESWPEYDEKLVVDDEVSVGVQINGKVRGDILVGIDATTDDVREMVMKLDFVVRNVEGKEVKKFIYVPGRIISIVI